MGMPTGVATSGIPFPYHAQAIPATFEISE